jgi:hypothetical protein
LLVSYGSKDYPAVQRKAKELESLLEDMPPGSAQIRIEGAGHYFDDYNEELAGALTGWQEKTTAGYLKVACYIILSLYINRRVQYQIHAMPAVDVD